VNFIGFPSLFYFPSPLFLAAFSGIDAASSWSYIIRESFENVGWQTSE